MTASRPRCASPGCDRPLPRRGARFCGRSCYRLILRAKPSQPVSIPGCQFCGGPKPRRNRPFCGRACAAAARRKPRPPCRSCGAPVPRADRPCCSLLCSRAWQQLHPSRPWAGVQRPEIRGERHPRWKGDQASLSAKRRRLLGLHPRVQRCGICRLPGVQRARDGDPGNPAPTNLVWRCRTCLARYHRPRRVKRRSSV